ncbi:MAG: alpha/beta hydrolase [Eubacteriales bacterium]|nr:alpha/beta hydrolase [Eubacteriales bacterium]
MKIAVIFPGIGYHTDKPLLYHSKRIAKEAGYEIVEVPYKNFPGNVRGNAEKMTQCFQIAFEQSETILAEVDFSKYDEILFISKSVGTAVASAYANEHGLSTRNIYYTPVAKSFDFMKQEGIVFHGTSDPWVESDAVVNGCEKLGFPLFITENGNHSLEIGDALVDLKNLVDIMERTKSYILKDNK